MRRPHMIARAGSLAGASPGLNLERATVEEPQIARRGRKNTLVAAVVIALVLLTATGWLVFGAQGVSQWLATGQFPVTSFPGSGALQGQPAPAGAAGQSSGQPVDIGSWMPLWIAVELAVFVWLGLFLRADQGHKP